jgi:hypothetical protein
LKEFGQWFNDFVVLWIDVDAKCGPRHEKVFEEGDRSNSIDTGLRNL